MAARSLVRALASLALAAALPSTHARAAEIDRPLTVLPQTPSLDPAAMDRSVDPCVDFYHYSCGGWIKSNPIPADKSRWSVYGKLTLENKAYLWGLLEDAAKQTPNRTPEQQKVGDYFASCMDEAAVEAAGVKPLKPYLDAIDKLGSVVSLAALEGGLARDGVPGFYSLGSGQDFGDATQVIVFAGAGGLGLPDRDYYVAEDAKSKEGRARYVDHLATLLQLVGESPGQAIADANRAMVIETTLAAASLTRVERRQPEKIYHKMTLAQLQALTPSYDWKTFLQTLKVDPGAPINVTQPAFYQAFESILKNQSIGDIRAYLRARAVDAAAPHLSKKFADEDFAFRRAYLQGAKQIEPRWQRCVQQVDDGLGEALGKVFVEKTFTPEAKQGADTMVKEIEQVMETHIKGLDWMSAATKEQALAKLHGMRNKIGYPAHWRDYSKMTITRNDYFGNAVRMHAFEVTRDLAKIGKPVDLEEWGMTPPTVNAYYNPSMNDINFPAGVLQPPLYDPRSDAAPNYGNTGSTVGHELTHGFDDEGSRFDAGGNLKNWWTEADRAEFEKRAQCVSDQYANYVIVDDIKINSKLTLGEDLADLGGTVLAYEAWQQHTANQKLQPVDGLTPDQRFFVGLAQWACGDEREESLRVSARTNPHSPLIYRINGLVVNIPEFAPAFSCKAGQPMYKDPAKVCKVW